MANNFLSGLETGYNIGADFIDRRRARERARIGDQRDDAAYTELNQRFGPAAAQRTGDTVALQSEQRAVETAARERQQQAGLAAVGSLRQAFAGIPEGTPPEQAAQMRGAAFDRIAQIMPALGLDAPAIGQLREVLISNPEMADQIYTALQNPDTANLVGMPQAAIGPDGQPTFVGFTRSGQMRPYSGYQPAQTVLGQQRADTASGNLAERIEENDPENVAERNRAEAFGTRQGEAAANLDSMRSNAERIVSSIDDLLNDEAFDSIFGLPNLARLETGGFGAAGVVPGTPAADALGKLNQVVGQVQGQAMEMLEGQTPVSDADRQAVASSLANLDRAQSPAQVARALRELQRTVTTAYRNAERLANERIQRTRPRSQRSTGTRTPTNARAARGGPRRGGAQSGGANARQPNESMEAYLRRLGLD